MLKRQANGGVVKMNVSRRCRIFFPLVSALATFAISAHAEEQHKPAAKAAPVRPAVQAVRPGPMHAGPGPVHAGPGPVRAGPAPGRGPQVAHVGRGRLPSHNFAGHAYHGHVAWQGGHWRHEIHDGRDGWWWDVGGAWYFYPQQMDGPPDYVSDVEAIDDAAGPDGPPVEAGYAPPPGAYAPPPPPPDPAASAVGGAIVGGLLGGLITHRPGGAAAGAIIGGTTGALVGAEAAQRPGYYLSQGGCYYRYPSGQYVPVDPRSCN